MIAFLPLVAWVAGNAAYKAHKNKMNTYQQTFLTIPLAALGAGLYPPFELPDGTKVKVRIKLLDTIRFMIARWTDEPDVVVGLPVVAGVPLEQIAEVVKKRLFEEYERRRLSWPEQAMEQPTGQN